MDLNKTYEKVINLVIVPKYDFISGIEALKVTKDVDYIFNFATTANKFYNGKVLQVSNTTP